MVDSPGDAGVLQPEGPGAHAIRNRLVATIAISCVAVLAAAGLALGGLMAANRDLDTSVQRLSSLRDHASELWVALLDEQASFRGYELTGDDSFQKPYRDALAREQQAATDFAAVAGNDPVLQARLNDVERAAGQWQATWVQPVSELVAKGDLTTARQRAVSGGGEQLFGVIRARLAALDDAVGAPSEQIHNRLSATTDAIMVAAVAIAVSVLVGLMLLGWYLLRTVGGPLEGLVRTTRDIRAGRHAVFVAKRNDEIGVLARALEEMRADRERQLEKVRADAELNGALSALSDQLSFAGTEDELVDVCVGAVETLTGHQTASVWLLTPSGNRLALAGGPHNPALDALADDGDAEGERLVEASSCPAIRAGRTHVPEAGAAGGRVRCDVGGHLEGHDRACLLLAALGRPVGVLHVGFAADRPIQGQTLDVLRRMAEQVSIAISNRRLMMSLEGMAMTDSLTGLKNARFIDEYLERELAGAQREAREIGAVMLDFDHFKEFNDRYGHPAGDSALRIVSAAIRSAIRASDTVARYGGEEFLVVVRNASIAETAAVAEKIRAAVAALDVQIRPGETAKLTVSAGVAGSSLDGYERADLIRRADEALYRAKRLGRNRVIRSDELRETSVR